MPAPLPITKTEISAWLRQSGKDREWLASELKVSLSIVNQWLAPKGIIPDDRLVSIAQLMERDTVTFLGDPEGNLVSFTLEEFERIEATRLRLHYESRPPMYSDAILAYIEADEAAQRKILSLPPPALSTPKELDLVAESPSESPAAEETPTRRHVRYTKGRPRPQS